MRRTISELRELLKEHDGLILVKEIDVAEQVTLLKLLIEDQGYRVNVRRSNVTLLYDIQVYGEGATPNDLILNELDFPTEQKALEAVYIMLQGTLPYKRSTAIRAEAASIDRVEAICSTAVTTMDKAVTAQDNAVDRRGVSTFVAGKRIRTLKGKPNESSLLVEMYLALTSGEEEKINSAIARAIKESPEVRKLVSKEI